MSQGFNLQQALQSMSNKMASMDQRLVQLGQENQRLARVANEAKIIAETLKNVQVSPMGGRVSSDFKSNVAYAKAWGGGSYVSLGEIKGRFVPFDTFVEIPIPNDASSAIEGTLKVSMEGPFVAARRYAVFLSQYSYQVTFSNGTTAVFKGRTNGRFRGVSSNTDLCDALRAFEQPNQYQPSYLGAVWDGAAVLPVGNPAGVNPASTDPTNMLPNFPGTGRPLLMSPLSMSGGRSMNFDGTIAIEPQGAQFRRQNIPIPSSLWTDGENGPVDLACYDVLEPGEEVIVRVNPLHINNPAYGNISGLAALNASYTFNPVTGVAANNPLPVGSWPFLQSQFDGHEGINDETLLGDTSVDVDRVTRIADGVLVIGYMGFRIIAAPGSLSERGSIGTRCPRRSTATSHRSW